MSERNELVPPGAALVGATAPSFLDTYTADDQSTVEMERFRLLSRVKRVQAMAKQDLKAQFGEGAAIIVPERVLLCKPNGAPDHFLFVPLYFLTEYTTQSDIKDKGSNFIVDRSFDPAGEIARKAADAKTRVEDYGAGFKRRHVEHLCFLGVIYGANDAARGTVVCLDFSRGEYTTGQRFVAQIKMRRTGSEGGRTAPLWSQVWQFTPKHRTNDQNQWWGLEPSNPPPDQLYIRQDECEVFKGMHDTLKTEYQAKRLGIRREDEGADEHEAVVTEPSMPEEVRI